MLDSDRRSLTQKNHSWLELSNLNALAFAKQSPAERPIHPGLIRKDSSWRSANQFSAFTKSIRLSSLRHEFFRFRRNDGVFLDLENLALGAHEAQFPAFDVRKVIERLLLKGHIVVKKAYCDFERYKTFKRGLHEAAFELIEIPHLRQSGKNSADIRMVVDALDLCYTKSHVDTFVIISGDSDFLRW